MRSLPSLSLVAGAASPQQLDNSTVAAIIANESGLTIQVNLGSYSRWLPAWTVDIFWLPSMIRDAIITLNPMSISNNTNPPSAVALITEVLPGDEVQGTYPYALTRQVSSNVTASSSYTLLAPDNLNFVSLDDVDLSGGVIILPSQAPTPTGALDIAMAYRVSSSLIQLLWKSIAASNLFQMMVPFNFEATGGTAVKGLQVVSGTGPGTFNHNLGITPQGVWPCPTQVAEAFFAGSYTSTTFTVGGVTSTHQWKALVIA